jgi:hypothetical protein
MAIAGGFIEEGSCGISWTQKNVELVGSTFFVG